MILAGGSAGSIHNHYSHPPGIIHVTLGAKITEIQSCKTQKAYYFPILSKPGLTSCLPQSTKNNWPQPNHPLFVLSNWHETLGWWNN